MIIMSPQNANLAQKGIVSPADMLKLAPMPARGEGIEDYGGAGPPDVSFAKEAPWKRSERNARIS